MSFELLLPSAMMGTIAGLSRYSILICYVSRGQLLNNSINRNVELAKLPFNVLIRITLKQFHSVA